MMVVPDTSESVKERTDTDQQQIKFHNLGVIRYGWIIATLHIKHYTGRSQVSRGDPVGQGQTGEVQSRKICEEWDSPGKRRRWQLSTDKNGVGVWPNTLTWTWDESSQVKSFQGFIGSADELIRQSANPAWGLGIRQSPGHVPSQFAPLPAERSTLQAAYSVVMWSGTQITSNTVQRCCYFL